LVRANWHHEEPALDERALSRPTSVNERAAARTASLNERAAARTGGVLPPGNWCDDALSYGGILPPA
jgi:hypothetical protein